MGEMERVDGEDEIFRRFSNREGSFFFASFFFLGFSGFRSRHYKPPR